MGFTTTALILGGLGGFGIAEVASGMNKSADNKPNAPAAPDPTKAQADATSTVNNQRQILLAAGGQTDYTGGLGVLTGSDVSKSSLVGS